MILKHDRPIIGIDIDGTLRDIEDVLEHFIEKDHPKSLEEFRRRKGNTYRLLDKLPDFSSIAEVYRWMYEERVFEIFGTSPRLHSRIIDNVNAFADSAKATGFDVVLATVQRNQSVTATLHWLARWGCKVQNVLCFDTGEEKAHSGIDIFIEDSPETLREVLNDLDREPIYHPITEKELPRCVRVVHGYNEDIEDCPCIDIKAGNFNDLYEILDIQKILYR